MGEPTTQDRDLIHRMAAAAAAHAETRLTVVTPDDQDTLTRAEVYRFGRRVASRLQALGVMPGDVVAVQLPNTLAWAACAVAVAELQAVLLPIWTAYGSKELGFILRDAGARIYVSPGQWKQIDFHQRLREANPPPTLRHLTSDDLDALRTEAFDGPLQCAPPRDASATAVLLYTSGTTSQAKGVRHSYRSWMAEIQAQPSRHGGPRLGPWPVGHIAGALEVYMYLCGGPELILMAQWDPRQAAELIAAHHIYSTSGTPYHLATLLDAADELGADVSSLVDYLTGAAPVPAALIERCARLGIRTYRSYGATEHPTVSMGSPEDPLDKRLSTEGRLMQGVAVRILDEAHHELPPHEFGEIATRGPDRCEGYLDASLDREAFTADGWYLTGDIGRLDSDGYLQVVDRKKDIIIRGGSNISSREVEDCLALHPDIQEAAVVAAPHPTLGEIVCAVVALKPGRQISLTSVAEFLAQQGLARFKTPERLETMDSLPRNLSGKLLKKELRAWLQGLPPRA